MQAQPAQRCKLSSVLPVLLVFLSQSFLIFFGRYLCRFILSCVTHGVVSDNACIPDSFWHAFPATSQVPRCHNNAMRAKKENVDGEAFRNNFTLLAPGLEMYSTLRQPLAATDSSVSLILVFRDEAFRCTVLMCSLAALGHDLCRRPLSLNAQFHRELCRCSFFARCFST